MGWTGQSGTRLRPGSGMLPQNFQYGRRTAAIAESGSRNCRRSGSSAAWPLRSGMELVRGTVPHVGRP
ncbi:MAG: hypothetical protein LBQ79_12520 [Deltaproteobacteria bacterium]|jgi:hypothetical protein|nr:hypothetical protein [Deltaproteobacteria bacterium]